MEEGSVYCLLSDVIFLIAFTLEGLGPMHTLPVCAFHADLLRPMQRTPSTGLGFEALPFHVGFVVLRGAYGRLHEI